MGVQPGPIYASKRTLFVKRNYTIIILTNKSVSKTCSFEL